FQAEDGIRDFHVTGVQTCALPILRKPGAKPGSTSRLPVLPGPGEPPLIVPTSLYRRMASPVLPMNRSPAGLAQRMLLESVKSERSEERRVGKGCRSRTGGGG